MALNKTLLKQEILLLMKDMQTREEDALEEFANRLSTAIDSYVKSITIQYVAGLANQGGPVVGAAQFTVL